MYLTKRQKEVLDYIATYLDGHGYAPTLEEIGAHFGLSSPATVYKHVQQLVDKGYLRKTRHQGRGLEIVRATPTETLEVPVRGHLAAGRPVEAAPMSETVDLPASFIDGGTVYGLRVRGNSLQDEQLVDGDVLVIEDRDAVSDGETVVATLDNALAAVGRFYREPGYVRLQPRRAGSEPLYLPEGQVQVRGVVVGLVRKYR